MADDLPLFDMDIPEPPSPAAKESQGRRRTRRQADLLRAGQHPLSTILGRPLPLHAEAAPAGDRRAPGRRCGNCAFRRHNHHGYPKCTHGDGARASCSDATDCRAWWPACVDHEWKEDDD